jgi:riboflavin kinase/FMN adenylyltransferase
MAGSSGFDLEVVPLVAVDGAGASVSSSAIRERLAAGDPQAAAQLLGRPYEVRGIVEQGDRRGRTLGYPTANVAVGGDVMLPADGVYAGSYRLPDGTEWPAAVSVGRRPTFYEDNGLLLVEAFLLDFDGELYGQRTAVRFTDFVRGQERFDSAADLIAQMDLDVAEIRRVIG